MKMYFCGVALTLLAITNVSAQKAPIKFGDVPMEDLKMTSYAPDTSAAAVVLADYGEARISVTSTVTMNFERHIRIKILKKEGLDFANAEVLLYHVGSGEEKVAQLKAATYNLEAGKIVENKMSKDGVFKEKFNKYFDRQKFTLPNVKVGSVIEYSYTVISEFYTNFPNWRFQTSIPTRLSEYYAFIPEFFHYQKYLQGYVPITNYEVTPKPTPSYEAQVHHWICKDVPAFKKEPYMTSEDDYVSKINFALARVNFPGQLSQEIMTSWASLNKGLVEDSDFMGVINGSGFLKKNAEEVIAGITEPVDKIRAIHSYVKNNIEWTGEKEMYPGNLKKVLEAKKGDAADINFILGSMLEKAGFAVDMVLLSTRDHGFVRQEFPMRKQFNYVICSVKLNDKTFLLDATEPFLPMELLPDRCLNGQGMVVSKLNHGWVNLETKAKSKTVITADLQLQDDGSLKGKVNYIRDGYDARDLRKDVVAKGEEKYKKELYTGKSWELNACEFENLKEVEKPFKENHDVVINEHVSSSGESMYINPFVTSQLMENPFRLETREYPVDFGNAQEDMYTCKLLIPENFTIDELPKSKVLMLPGNAARFLYNVSQTGNTISITSSLQINKSLFIQTEYPNLREFYNQVVAKQTEQIVLKRKQ